MSRLVTYMVFPAVETLINMELLYFFTFGDKDAPPFGLAVVKLAS